jgi:N-acetyl-gamma-glutamyl-phosphate/LysW-gamma-L-alpha-aminoadipyl-6-phosphate reductase
MNKLQVTIVGGSGYVGGELLRLLLFHPNVDVKQVTSERFVGKPISKIHPNLRGISKLTFSSISELENCDTIFLCLPHGKSNKSISSYAALASQIIDLSADFRIKDDNLYKDWYGNIREDSEFKNKFIYGIPELHREKMKNAKYISSAGCNATTVILGLYPFFKENLVEINRTVSEAKVGTSEGGNSFSEASHHPERSGSIRSYKPVGHRHTAEMIQELSFEGTPKIHFSATSIEMVRGILATSHIFLKENLLEKDIWKLYRKYYYDEPFIRIVKERDGIYRFPDPKILIGTNYCDIGFIKDTESKRVVVISAIDNLMKGAAGQAVQAFNISNNFDEKTGLNFPGFHPI